MIRPGTWNGDDFFGAAILMVIAALVGLGAWFIIKLASADGRIQHCFVEYSVSSEAPPTYVVRGYRSWCSNVIVGMAPDVASAEAIEKADPACVKAGH